MLIGFGVGLVSAYGFLGLLEKCQERGLYDTCGV